MFEEILGKLIELGGSNDRLAAGRSSVLSLEGHQTKAEIDVSGEPCDFHYDIQVFCFRHMRQEGIIFACVSARGREAGRAPMRCMLG